MQHAWKVGQKWPKKTKINHFETFGFAQVGFQINFSYLKSATHLKKRIQNFASTLIDIILAETKLQLPRPIIADTNTTDIDAVHLLKYFMRNGLDLKPTSFLARSLFSLQMDSWLKIFKKENRRFEELFRSF